MKITNYEIVQRLSAVNIFINIEKEGGKALLSPVGEYALNYNRKILANAYEPYAETLKSLEDDEEKIMYLGIAALPFDSGASYGCTGCQPAFFLRIQCFRLCRQHSGCDLYH
jgi:hypothetical protein